MLASTFERGIASKIKYLKRSSVFWNVRHRWLRVSYRRFETTYLPPLEDGTDRLSQKSLNNY